MVLTMSTSLDMDGDGDLDIVSASKDDDTIAWYEHDGAADPSWTAADIATTADVALNGVQVADMDGDGDLDIVSRPLKTMTPLPGMKMMVLPIPPGLQPICDEC